MNAFVLHHQDSIEFGYSCFDRILFNAHVPGFQRPGTVAWFLRHRGEIEVVTPTFLRNISSTYHEWVADTASRAGIPIVEPPKDVRREEWVEPFYRNLAQRPGTAVILKCREPARVAISLPARGHFIDLTWRFVNLYYFYLNDPECGRMFLRLCPYFPFNGQVCLNGHRWLAKQMDREGIAYCQKDNSFLACAAPQRLQQLADDFAPEHCLQALDRALADWLSFFTPTERQQGFRHHLYVSQVEYCHNLIFRKPVHRLFDRLLDANRSIGRPDKLAIIFGRPQVHPDTRTGQTVVKITPLHTQVLSSRFRSTSLKQYVKENVLLRTEGASYQLQDLSVAKNIQNLPKIREILATSNERYLQVQQDVLLTHVDRGQLEKLRQPTISPSGRRTPGLRWDDPRLLALFQALTCFVHLVGKGFFRTAALLGNVQRALDRPHYTLSQLRYDLGKLRAKGFVQRVPQTQLYQLTSEGYRVAILCCKLYHRLYAPLLQGIHDPFADDNLVPYSRQSKLDRLYAAVDRALSLLTQTIGIAA